MNALAPGFFESEMTEQYAESYPEQQFERMLINRAGDPTELPAAMLFLASPVTDCPGPVKRWAATRVAM